MGSPRAVLLRLSTNAAPKAYGDLVQYSVAATDVVRAPRSTGIVAGQPVDSEPTHWNPTGVLHAVAPSNARTACGLSTEGLHPFPFNWAAVLVNRGRCGACAVAIDEAD